MRRDMETYGGLLNGCAPGAHASLVELLMDLRADREGVLDLGAGSGALLGRLRDAGFQDLNAADFAAPNFGLADVPWTRVDLNRDFSRSFERRFNVICMSEVIEHLKSPRNALEQARELLVDGGWLALSTPNIGFWEGQLKFALTGELWGFGEANYRSIRHISPLESGQLRLTLQEIGFETVAFTTAGSFATPLRWCLLSPLWAPMLALGGRQALGECLVILARKVAPDAALSRPTIYDDAWADVTGSNLEKAREFA